MSKKKIYSTAKGSLQSQAEKYFNVNIRKSFNIPQKAWPDGKPHLHYELVGDAWVKLDGTPRANFDHMKDMVTKVCEDFLNKNPIFKLAPVPFDCGTDITFNFVPEKIVPLTSN